MLVFKLPLNNYEIFNGTNLKDVYQSNYLPLPIRTFIKNFPWAL